MQRLALLIAILFLSIPAIAAPIKSIGKNGHWEAFTIEEKGGKICYAATSPDKKKSENKTTTFFMVTHGPGKGNANVVSLTTGFKFKEKSEVEITIGKSKHKLFTKEDGAWAPNAEIDKTIVKAMKEGKSISMKVTPAKGKAMVDTYSLEGFNQTITLINKACGIK